MARLERESLGRPSKDGQTIGGCNVFLTESIGRSALVESITHRMDVEKPPILETACGAQSLVLEFKYPHGPVRKLNLVAPKGENLDLMVGGRRILFNGSETIVTGLNFGYVTSGELVYDESFRLRLLSGTNGQTEGVIEIGLGSSPILVTLTGVPDFIGITGEAELRRSYIDLAALRNGF